MCDHICHEALTLFTTHTRWAYTGLDDMCNVMRRHVLAGRHFENSLQQIQQLKRQLRTLELIWFTVSKPLRK
jgi:hypothetical protein